jgi:uncharacterized OB-fold protein
MTESLQTAPRMLPPLGSANRLFWTSGRNGRLQLLRRKSTGRWVHPFWGVADDDPDVEPQAVSGSGSVFTFTSNLQSYVAAVPTPYLIAIVQLDEQDDLRIVTNLVGCSEDEVTIGARVRVRFEAHDAYSVPVFELDRPV